MDLTPIRSAPALAALLAATAAMAQDTAPTVNVQGSAGAKGAVAPPPPAFLVVARTDKNEVVAASDLPLVLTKLRREEQALVRRAIYYSGSVSLTRPANLAPDDPVTETCRWSYKTYLLRRICLSSITGAFACTEPEVVDLTEGAEGQADLTVEQSASNACNEGFAPVASARARLVQVLRGRSEELFAADQTNKVEPMFKAAGVTAVKAAPPAR